VFEGTCWDRLITACDAQDACADNAATFYVKMPSSRCATLVRQALEGDPTAIEKLKDTPDYCKE
jgi:hypothetical protein